MDILRDKSDRELHRSILAEMAKAQNELRCLRNDLDKAQGRLSFVIAVSNYLINKDKED